jgi:Mg-chelatase subunit ChlD
LSRCRGAPVAAVLALGLMALPAPSQGAPLQPAEPRGCSIRGEVTLSSKIGCRLDPVEARVTLRPRCTPSLDSATPFRSVHLTVPLPGPLEPIGRGPDGPANGGGALEWHFSFTTDRPAQDVFTATQRLRSPLAGTYVLGEGAQVWLEDSQGRTVDGTVDTATLTIGDCVPISGARLHLPVAHRPTCIPLRQPADIVLALDLSSSVGPTGLADAGRWAQAFLDSVDLSRDRVAVVGFAERAQLLAPLTNDHSRIEQSLARLTLAPGTRIERAIELAVAELSGERGRMDRRRMVAIISDGVQTGSGGPQAVMEAAQRARLRGIAILTVALGTGPDRKLLAAISADPAHSLYAPTADDLQRAYRELADVAACAQ